MALVFVQSRTHTGSAVLTISAPETNTPFGTFYSLGTGQCGVQFLGGFDISAELIDATSLATSLGYNVGGQVASPDHSTGARILANFSGFSVGVSGGDQSVTSGADVGAIKLVTADTHTFTVTLTADVYQDSITHAFQEQVTGCTATFGGMTLTIARTTGSVPNIWSGISATRYVGPVSTPDGQDQTIPASHLSSMTWRGPSNPSLQTQFFSAAPSASMNYLPSVLASVDTITWSFDADFNIFTWPVNTSNGTSVTEVTGIDASTFHNNDASAYAVTVSHISCIIHATSTTITADKNGNLSTNVISVVQRTNLDDSVNALTPHNLAAIDARLAKNATGTGIYTADLVTLFAGNPSNSTFVPNLNFYTVGRLLQTVTHSLVNNTLTSTSSTGSTGPCCLHDREGRLYVASCNTGGISVMRCDAETPPFTQTVLATTTAGDCSPALVLDTGHNLRLLFLRGSDILEVVSGDFGQTWSAPTTMFTGASHPRARCHPRSGATVRLAWRSGTIVGTIQQTPKGAISAEFTLKDNSGANIAAIDDAFDFSPANSQNEHLWIIIVRASSTVNSTYSSTDNCRTAIFEA